MKYFINCLTTFIIYFHLRFLYAINIGQCDSHSNFLILKAFPMLNPSIMQTKIDLKIMWNHL